MRVSSFLPVLLLFALAACDSKSGSPSDTAPEKPAAPAGAEVESTSYVQYAQLNIATTDGELSEVKDNAVTLSGFGRESTYTAKYRFNSRTANSFEVIKTSYIPSPGCNGANISLSLKSDNDVRPVRVGSKVGLKPNTDYALEATAAPECKEFSMTFSPLVWLGDASVNPEVAYVCTGETNPIADFFINLNGLTMLTGESHDSLFLDYGTYCGELAKGSENKCKASISDYLAPDYYSEVSCATGSGEERRKFDVTLDAQMKRAELTCYTGDKKTHFELFKSCSFKVLDYAL